MTTTTTPPNDEPTSAEISAEKSATAIPTRGSKITLFILIFALILSFRLMNAYVVKTWYVPDEVFQSVEIAHYYNYNQGFRTWEWSPKVALRSFNYPAIFAYLWKLSDYLGGDIYARRIIPHIFHAVLAAISDLFLFKFVLQHWGPRASITTLLFQISSYWVFYTCTRTLTNSLEMALFPIFLYFWYSNRSKHGPGAFHVINTDHNTHVHSISWNTTAIFVALISFVLRPTAILPFIPFFLRDIFSLFYEHYHLNSIFINLAKAAFISAIVIGINCFIDYQFYGALHFVPLNFFAFNTGLGSFHVDASFYGTHPFLWYFYAGFPVICGLSFPVFCFYLYNRFFAHKQQQTPPQKGKSNVKIVSVGSQSAENVFLVSILFTILIYSLIPHKEFRFIQGLLPLVHILCALALSSKNVSVSNSIVVIAFVLIISIFPAGYLSMGHQTGPFGSLQVFDVMIPQNYENENTRFLHIYEKDVEARFFIHFLMPCHSAPYFASLHRPWMDHPPKGDRPFHLSMRLLDCSPLGLFSNTTETETDRFYRDPLAFVERHYVDIAVGHFPEPGYESADEFDPNWKVNPPHAIVIYDGLELAIQPFLDLYNYNLVGIIKHTDYPDDRLTENMYIFRKQKQTKLHIPEDY